MEEQKKRKVEDLNGENVVSNEQLRSLLDPLPKNQLVDLLSKLYVFFFFLLLSSSVSNSFTFLIY